MNLSENGLKFIKKQEGCKLYWYELADGGFTCGYGHWVPHATAVKLGIKKGQLITQKQADNYLRQDMQKFIDHTNAIVNAYGFANKLNQNQFDALVSYCFNRGPGNAQGTNGLRQLLKNSKTPADISKNFMIYWGTNPTYKKGLLNRRKAEQILFNTKVVDEMVFKDKELQDMYDVRKNSPATKALLKSSAAKYLNLKKENLDEGDYAAIAYELAVHFAKNLK